MMKRLFALLLALSLMLLPGVDAFALDDWAPDGPVTVIVAYGRGTSTDLTAQLLMQYAEKYIGQSLVIENVPGGSGSAGWSALADAAPDGLTIGFLNLPSFNSSIVSGAGAYTTDSFTPICNHVTETSLVIVRADDDRFGTLDDLVAYGREHSGKGDKDMLKASTNGPQASNHIGAQAFANSAGFQYTDIPQDNTADELLCLRRKDADFCVAKVSDIAGMDSDLRVLGVFSQQRVPEYPDAPTLGELGYYDQWLGSSRCITAPAGVSDEVVAFYDEAFRLAMADKAYLAAAAEAGVATDYQNAEAAAAMIDRQQSFTESLTQDFWPD